MGSSDQLEWEVEVYLQSDTPVVGVELNPRVHVNAKQGSHVSPPNYAVKFFWYRRLHHQTQDSEKKAWVEVGRTKNHVPSATEIGCKLCLVSVAVDDKDIQRSPVKILSTNPVIPLPSLDPRCMVVFSEPKNPNVFTGKPFKEGSFRILCYNVLAELYIKKDAYSRHCPDWALTWEYRRQNLMREIVSYGADILCLQEVQSDHFKNFFQPVLAKFGYSAVYKKKTREVYVGNGLYIIDGCATFFRGDKFKIVTKYEVEYDKMALPVIETLEAGRKNEGIFRLMKDNVALAVILEVKENRYSQLSDSVGSRFCVANTHLHRGGGAASNASDVRLFQAVNLIRGLERIDASGFPVLVCGDMNSVPGSDPHRFLVSGGAGNFGARTQYSGDPLGVYKHLKLIRHSMNLASAYSSGQKMDYYQNIREPNGTLDYILYSENRLKVDGVLKLHDSDSTGKRPLPSPKWSSDHVALVANFRIKGAFRGRRDLLPPPDPWGRMQKQSQSQWQMGYLEKNTKTENSRLLAC